MSLRHTVRLIKNSKGSGLIGLKVYQIVSKNLKSLSESVKFYQSFFSFTTKYLKFRVSRKHSAFMNTLSKYFKAFYNIWIFQGLPDSFRILQYIRSFWCFSESFWALRSVPKPLGCFRASYG